MLNQSRYLGVDVSKETLKVAFERNRWEFPNSKTGHHQLIAQIKKLSKTGVIHVVCEATGHYHLAMCLSLQKADIPLSVCNPLQIHYFGRSEGKRAKTDPIDANLIERFGNSKRPQADSPLCAELIALSDLVNHRRQLVDSRKVLRTQCQAVLSAAVGKEIRRSIALMDARIKELEEQMRKLVEANAQWKKRIETLRLAKGVGFITALILLVKMPELGSLNRGQCGALAGVAPYDDESGNHHGHRSIKAGRAEVRSALYMAAMSAVRSSPVLKEFYQRLIKKNKLHKVAITAVMRKLIIYLNGLCKQASASPA